MAAHNYPQHIHASPALQFFPSQDEISVFEKIEKPESLIESFFQEVVTNIKKDFGDIHNHFLEKQGFGKLKHISIEVAGKERHYAGKVALYITFTDDKNHKIKVVYKPRNVMPDWHLENLLNIVHARLNEPRKTERTILCADKNHGYDTFIEGKVLNDGAIYDELIEAIRKYRTNRILICTLYEMGFEDTHGENFIYRNKHLYFIDAECFCTQIAVNLEDFIISDEVSKKINKILQKIRKLDLKDSFHEQLKTIPTRLVFCPTDIYGTGISANRWARQREYISEVTVGEKTFNTPAKFADYHLCLLGNFLCKNNFLDPNLPGVNTFEELNEKLKSCFAQEDALQIIENELTESQTVQIHNENVDNSLVEIPVFHFHLIQNVLICPLQGKQLKLKKEL